VAPDASLGTGVRERDEPPPWKPLDPDIENVGHSAQAHQDRVVAGAELLEGAIVGRGLDSRV
jgi:hypothetical protein